MTERSVAVIIPFPSLKRGPTAADRHNARRRARKTLWSLPVPVAFSDWQLVHYEKPVVVKAWLAMVVHMWLEGPIAGEPKMLAAAAGLTPRMWAKHAPILATFFQRRSDGAWFHPSLTWERDALLAEEEATALERLLASPTAVAPNADRSASGLLQEVAP